MISKWKKSVLNCVNLVIREEEDEEKKQQNPQKVERKAER
jgi:hypothetical protein